MKAKYAVRSGFTLVELLVVIAIMATLAGVGLPAIIGKLKDGNRAQATANAKSIGLALFTFESDYGSMPSAGGEGTTDKAVQEANPSGGFTFGTANSNDFYRQLVAAGVTGEGENIFYAKGSYTKKPDGVTTANKCLAAGECGFSYVMANQTDPLSSSGNMGRIIAASSHYNGTADGTFDPDVYARKAVVLRLDQSASEVNVRTTDKKGVAGNGKTVFEGGADTVWGADIQQPVIKPPLKSTGN